jgi:GNAT superfamily N-acetyltransferase
MQPPRLETLTGAAIAPLLPALARLRIAVFRDWPYLYDGDVGQEEAHLASFAASPHAALIVARDPGGTPIGCATAMPLAEAGAAVLNGLAGSGLDPGRTGYFGESVLLPEHRGQGIGVGFFTEREAHARSIGCTAATFCAVVRNPNDPRRPPGYAPLDTFWRRRGYTPRPDLSCVFRWREIGDDRDTPHALGFWLKQTL